MRAPAARASGLNDLEIIVDSGERYPYRFASQQATTVRAQLACGDYGLRRDGQLVAVVERKSLENLARSLVDGQMAGQLAELATAPRAAVVVEERYSRLFTLGHVARAAPGAAAADASRSPGLGRGERVRGLAEGRVPQVVLWSGLEALVSRTRELTASARAAAGGPRRTPRARRGAPRARAHQPRAAHGRRRC